MTPCRSSRTGTFPALTRPDETPVDWVPFRQIPLRAGMGRRLVWPVTAGSERHLRAGTGALWPAETGESIVAGHKAKLSGHRTKRKENPAQFSRRGPTARSVHADAGLLRTANAAECEAGSSGGSAGPVPASRPVAFLLRTGDAQDRHKQ